MSFDTSTGLYSLLAARINVPIHKEKRSDTICIKPMLFLCVRLAILILFTYILLKVRTLKRKFPNKLKTFNYFYY